MIEAARTDARGDIETERALLVERLAKLSEIEIKSFARVMHDVRNEANRGEIWDAAHFILDNPGDSGLTDFVSWLIAQGETTFRRTLADPDSLADMIDYENYKYAQFELLGYVAS